MSTDFNQELQSFQEFIVQQLSSGEPISPEEALDAWRTQHPSPEQYQEDVAAIREALADMEAGDTGRPFDEFDREFRKRHSLD
jgi:hypothetical protein